MKRRIDLEGVFLQIGLVPSTDWLEGTVERKLATAALVAFDYMIRNQ